MEIIELKWQGPLKFQEAHRMNCENYVYLHTIETNPERIYYVGHSNSNQSNRQDSHFVNLLSPLNSTFNISKIGDRDFYNYFTNNTFIVSVYKMIMIEGDINCLDWEKKLDKKARIIREEVVSKTNIYYAELLDSEIPLYIILLDLLKKIEANIQYYLIKKYKMDVYKKGKYKIGLNNVNNKYISQEIVLSNKYEKLSNEAKTIIMLHLDDEIDLSKENEEMMNKIKNKKLMDKWDDIDKWSSIGN